MKIRATKMVKLQLCIQRVTLSKYVSRLYQFVFCFDLELIRLSSILASITNLRDGNPFAEINLSDKSCEEIEQIEKRAVDTFCINLLFTIPTNKPIISNRNISG